MNWNRHWLTDQCEVFRSPLTFKCGDRSGPEMVVKWFGTASSRFLGLPQATVFRIVLACLHEAIMWALFCWPGGGS